MKTMVFISQPMKGFSDEEIKSIQRDIYNAYIASNPGKEFQLINPYTPSDGQMEMSDIVGHHDVDLLGKSISLMSYADVVIFAKHWEEFRGCRIEHKVCTYYNIPIRYA